MIKGKVTYKVPKGLSRKHIRDEVKRGLGQTGLEWHRNTLPGHFAESAAGRYRYQKRTAKHNAEKLRKFGHSKPLVFKGDMARQLMRMGRITSTSKGVRVVMKGPKYLYMQRRDQKQPDKAAEITRTTKSELRAIARKLHDTLRTRLSETAETLTTTF